MYYYLFINSIANLLLINRPDFLISKLNDEKGIFIVNFHDDNHENNVNYLPNTRNL